ncbi:hypothetical protein GF367_00675 [Candidatus Woesearchaeota archaeon]|nr:hypothetical protein [Candidatus Woesearchaeota archaeon]
MKVAKLPAKEQKLLQTITIIIIVILIVLFFTQHIIEAMIVGVVLLGAQRAYLYFRTKP